MMNIEILLKKVEAAIVSFYARHKPNFTGQLTLEINFFKGKAKDITKCWRGEKEKIEL